MHIRTALAALPAALAASALLALPAQAADGIKIGFSAPLSGPVAAVGQDQYDGFMLAIDAHGGRLGGQPASVVREDDPLKPELGNQIARKLIDGDKVDGIVGRGTVKQVGTPLPEHGDAYASQCKPR
jgi:branched-chain amino acid transport system substrate-binding protein